MHWRFDGFFGPADRAPSPGFSGGAQTVLESISAEGRFSRERAFPYFFAYGWRANQKTPWRGASPFCETGPRHKTWARREKSSCRLGFPYQVSPITIYALWRVRFIEEP